jgi:small conductance mechanosensitive channel
MQVVLDYLQNEILKKETADLILRMILHSGVLIAVGMVLLRLLDAALRRVRSVLPPGDIAGLRRTEQRAETLRQIVRSVGRTVLAVVVILVLADDAGIQTGPLIASAGILGLAIGFGAQSLVKDVISGFFVLLEDQYGVGDVVRIGTQDGVVEEMTLRVTVLRNFEGQVHVIPNGTIQTVTVLTKDWSRAVVDVPIAHSEDLARVFTVLERINNDLSVKMADRLLEKPQILGIERLSEDGLTIRLAAKTPPGKQGDVLHEWRRRVTETLHREGIELARRTLVLSDKN